MVAFIFQKALLVQLYGKNERSNVKPRAAQEIINKRSFREIAHMLHVAEATPQIYWIDAFAAGAPIDHLWLGSILGVGEEDFETVKDCIGQNNGNKLRSIRDELETFSYNQIRFVLACMIRDLNFQLI